MNIYIYLFLHTYSCLVVSNLTGGRLGHVQRRPIQVFPGPFSHQYYQLFECLQVKRIRELKIPGCRDQVHKGYRVALLFEAHLERHQEINCGDRQVNFFGDLNHLIGKYFHCGQFGDVPCQPFSGTLALYPGDVPLDPCLNVGLGGLSTDVCKYLDKY